MFFGIIMVSYFEFVFRKFQLRLNEAKYVILCHSTSLFFGTIIISHFYTKLTVLLSLVVFFLISNLGKYFNTD